ncbi:MAG: endonuclease/exonuclease/phosphatase family protein [Planctomycetota bacterium]|nr:MAG: endonuclease/exonuclease/phosphatase family protein [Planctomycetota bacterium]
MPARPRAEDSARAKGPSLRPALRVRIVAANLSSGRHQSYDEGHGERILRALSPDVVLAQELNVGSGSQAELEAFVRRACGAGFFVHREPRAAIPNGIISRWPFRRKGVWEDPFSPNREFAWACIELPGPRDLWAVSVHLLTRNPSVRAAEARRLVGLLAEHVPPEDYLVVGGDLNTRRDDEPALRTLAPLVACPRPPADARGRRGTNASRRRIYDWVLADPDLERWRSPVQLAGRRFSGGLVFDTRSFPALDELPPARRGDSAAENMQHMAVVREFSLPVER